MGTGAGKETGQSLVEFALVVWIFLILLIGMTEFGRAWMKRNIMTGAAREAARIYAAQKDEALATNRAEEVLSSAYLDSERWTITPDIDPVTATVTFTVDYLFPVVLAGFVPGLDNASIPLTSSTTMRIEP